MNEIILFSKEILILLAQIPTFFIGGLLVMPYIAPIIILIQIKTLKIYNKKILKLNPSKTNLNTLYFQTVLIPLALVTIVSLLLFNQNNRLIAYALSTNYNPPIAPMTILFLFIGTMLSKAKLNIKKVSLLQLFIATLITSFAGIFLLGILFFGIMAAVMGT
jgi:hypothetical protein